MVKEGEHDVTFLCDTVHICGSCARGFEDERQCIEHIDSDHGNIWLNKCKDCDEVIDGSLNLEWHIETEHGLKASPVKNVAVNVSECFICPICHLQSKNIESLNTHMNNIHGHREIQKQKSLDNISVQLSETCEKCPNCTFIGNNAELKKHTNLKHPKYFKCDSCEQMFVDKSSVEAHVRSMHVIEPFPCEVCGLVLANFTLLKEHMSQAHTAEHHACRFCGIISISKEDFETHLVEAHEEKVLLHTLAKEVEIS